MVFLWTNTTTNEKTTLTTAVTELNSDLANLFISEDVYIGVTFSNDVSGVNTKSVAKAGYTPVGVVGWYQGSGAHVFIVTAMVNNTDLTVRARRANNDAVSMTVEFAIKILYKKNV